MYVKCSVVVYLCIACWACLPIHGNKNINQNIFNLIYGKMFLNISKNILFETCWFEFSIVKAFCTFLFICLFLYSVFLEGGGQGEISNIHIYTLYIKVVSCMFYQDISGSSK